MENLAEYVIPLIIAGIYFFSNILTKKAQKKEEENQPQWEPPELEIEQTVDEEYSGSGELSAYDRRQLERREAAHHYREDRDAERSGALLPPPPVRVEMAPPPLPELTPVGSTYGSTIEQQLKKIEETKRRAEQINVQVAGIGDAPRATKRPASHRKPMGSIRRQLRDPAAAKAAFIYGEIFGPCVSSGEQSKIPGLG